jgi:hypothetical protein
LLDPDSCYAVGSVVSAASASLAAAALSSEVLAALAVFSFSD